MKKDDAYELLVKEYLSKCRDSGCDGCVAEYYCIKNNLRTDRYPQDDCSDKLKEYFKQA
jgi:hypothetical protein